VLTMPPPQVYTLSAHAPKVPLLLTHGTIPELAGSDDTFHSHTWNTLPLSSSALLQALIICSSNRLAKHITIRVSGSHVTERADCSENVVCCDRVSLWPIAHVLLGMQLLRDGWAQC
jgi:hypothetical protein